MKWFICLLIIFSCLEVVPLQAQQKDKYEAFLKKGEKMLADGNFEAALRAFSDAKICEIEGDKKRAIQGINNTIDKWTETLAMVRAHLILTRDSLQIEKEKVQQLKIALHKANVLIYSLKLAGWSELAYEKGDTIAAFAAALLARDTLEKYNTNNPTDAIVIPKHIYLTFNRAVLASKTKVVKHNYSYKKKPIRMLVPTTNEVFLIIGRDSTVMGWDSDLNVKMKKKNQLTHILTADLAPNGRSLLTTHKDSSFTLWGIDSLGNLSAISTQKKQAAAVLKGAFFNQGKQVLTIDGAGFAKVWDNNGQLKSEWQTPSKAPLVNFSFSSKKDKVLLHTINKIFLWDLNPRKKTVPKLLNFPNANLVYQAEFMPKSDFILLSSDNGIHIKNGRQIDTLHTQGLVLGHLLNHKTTSQLSASLTSIGLLAAFKKNSVDKSVLPVEQTLVIENGHPKVMINHGSTTASISTFEDTNTQCSMNLPQTSEVRKVAHSTDPVIANEATVLLMTHSDYSAKLWSTSGELLLDVSFDAEVIDAFFFKNKIIVLSQEGNLYSIPIMEKVYQDITSNTALIKTYKENKAIIAFNQNFKS